MHLQQSCGPLWSPFLPGHSRDTPLSARKCREGVRISRSPLEMGGRFSPADITLRKDFCVKISNHLVFRGLRRAVLSMEDPSVILLRVASHWWSLPLFRRSGSAGLGWRSGRRRLQRNVLWWVSLRCRCEMREAQG